MSEGAFSIIRWVIVDISESKFVPENIVLNKTFVCHRSDHPLVSWNIIIKQILLNHHQHVMIKKPLRSNISLYANFKASNNLLVLHLFNKHRENTNNFLKE